jgi:hypothetical protein
VCPRSVRFFSTVLSPCILNESLCSTNMNQLLHVTNITSTENLWQPHRIRRHRFLRQVESPPIVGGFCVCRMLSLTTSVQPADAVGVAVVSCRVAGAVPHDGHTQLVAVMVFLGGDNQRHAALRSSERACSIGSQLRVFQEHQRLLPMSISSHGGKKRQSLQGDVEPHRVSP